MGIIKSGRFSSSRLSIWIFSLIIVFFLVKVKYWTWENRVIAWDVVSYYAYLPATFIYKDLSLEFTENYKGPHKFTIWPETGPDGQKLILTSMGLSYLYAPFFFMGHLAALITGADAGGYSYPYKIFLLLGALVFFIIGMLATRKLLLRYFNEKVTTITLISLVAGTNLFWYSTFEGTVSHVYSFSMIAIFLLLCDNWFKDQSIKTSILLGLVSGLISLIRPTNALIGIVFLLWNVTSWKELTQNVQLFLRKFWLIIIILGFAILIWIPQMTYWKVYAGHWLYYSYGDTERFFFNNPQIIKGLFSYTKGWLIYTPVMIFSLIGIFFLSGNLKKFKIPILIFTLLNIYIIFSWWCWWYGGGFGLRAFIDTYALLSIPMAAFLSYSFKQKILIKRSLIGIFTLFVLLGTWFTIKYYYGSIHWDSMTKKAFWNSFYRATPGKGFGDELKSYDYEKARNGIYVLKENK